MEHGMWIEALRIEGGMLDGLDQRFSPKLNVIIGGRGTGKSSVIELIRFCLGATPYTEDSQKQSMEHALGVLGDGKAVITLTDGNQKIEIARTAQDNDPDEVYSFPAPFIFSQSEVETIGLQAQSRRRLIDDFITPQLTQKAEELPVAAKVRSATAEIRTILTEIDDITEKTAELPKLQAQLEVEKNKGAAQTNVHKEIEINRKSLAELTPLVAAARVRSETIARMADRLDEWSSDLERLFDRKPSLEPWPVQAGTVDELTDLRSKENRANDLLKTSIEEIRRITSDLNQRKIAASSQRIGLENRARAIRQKIEETQKGASTLDKQISDLTQQISVLKSLLELRQERETRVKRLTEQRSKLLEQLNNSRQNRTAQRENATFKLSKNLGPAIRVSVIPYSQHREYVSTLAATLRGSGLRYTELAERIAETFSPQEIASLVETRNFSAISATLGMTDERSLRLCHALRGSAGAALFTTIVEDDIRIELMDGTDYKSIDFLSMGQRCTAVLPIILQHTERLIILDQPEDHLDNAFVVGTLVKAIMARSGGAQTIIATHNPNIPVLADAEQVIHLDSDGSRCFVRFAGPIEMPRIVDAITTIMEGGHEAFKKRAAFYAEHLPNDLKR